MVLLLNLALIGGLLIAGRVSGAVSLLAAAGDTAADSVALLLGLVAVTVRDRPGADPARSRATTIVALVNGVLLLVVTAIIVAEAVHRLRHGSYAVLGLPMLLAAVVTCVVLLPGAVVLGRDAGREDVHMRSVLIDTLADATAAGAVAVAGGIIAATGRFHWLDPALALLVGGLVVVAALHLLRDGLRQLRGERVDFDLD